MSDNPEFADLSADALAELTRLTDLPISRRKLLAKAGALALGATFLGPAAALARNDVSSGGTLIIAMTATNIPGTDSGMAESEGGEGLRFVGLQMYDGLMRFDLTQGDHAPDIKPGLAESYTVSKDATHWTFTLRKGVKFHDGTPWNADAAIFNLNRYTNQKFKYYYPALAANAGLLLQGIHSFHKLDNMKIGITTKGPWSYLLSDLATLTMASPTGVMKYGNDNFYLHPAGTGPFKFVSMVRGQQLVMAKNPDYWRGAPKLDKLIVRPIPDPTARLAALKAGEVNWIEVPPPDAVPQLRSSYQVLTKPYSHVWPWVYDMTKTPWNNVDIRQAANYAIDRDQLCSDILKGTGSPALQYAPHSDPGFEPSLQTYGYDPDKAKALLKKGGMPKGFSTTVVYPTSGSGNMVPTPMNEFLQSNLGDVGINVKLEPIEWGAMLKDYFVGKIPLGADAINISLGFVFLSLWYSWFDSKSVLNVGKLNDPKVDAGILETKKLLNPAARSAAFAKVNAELLKSAPWLLVVNDLNPRVLAPSVKGFVMPRSWFVDLTNTYIAT
jgi:peptide/nickel transport system substrate-binding protein